MLAPLAMWVGVLCRRILMIKVAPAFFNGFAALLQGERSWASICWAVPV